jgi:hypothetical protein
VFPTIKKKKKNSKLKVKYWKLKVADISHISDVTQRSVDRSRDY